MIAQAHQEDTPSVIYGHAGQLYGLNHGNHHQCSAYYNHSFNCFESVFDTCLVVRNQGIKMEEMLLYMYYQIFL
jgi:hypothetical protein